MTTGGAAQSLAAPAWPGACHRTPILPMKNDRYFYSIVSFVMLVLTVLSINVFGDAVRDALDPRATQHLKT